MTSLLPLCASARTASFSLDAGRQFFVLERPQRWQLADSDGTVQAEGSTATVVFTITGLMPATAYRLIIDGARLDFETAPESTLIDITTRGASPEADNNAPAIQSAIDQLPPGGTLKIPSGTFRTGPLFLKSDMTLLLEEGACLLGHPDRSLYPVLPAHHGDGRVLGTWEGVAEACFASLITAIDCRNLRITGAGTIDGGGDAGDWWTWPKETREGARRPRTLFISNGREITLSGITVRNSPSWTIHPVFCENLLAADLKIENDPLSPNTDGFNPECCRDVTLTGLSFSVGDDCIAIKAGKRDPKGGLDQSCERITIENCRMERGHGGVVIGSEMSGGVRDVTVRRCILSETDRGLRVKTRRGRGGAVSNITLEDCVMDRVAMPLVINSFYFCDADGRSDYVQSRQPIPVDNATPRISGITIRNVVARNVGVAAAAFYGLPEAPITGIVIDNYQVTYDPDARSDVPDMALNFQPMRHGAIIAEHAEFTRRSGIRLPSPDQSIAV
ncbi:polygalacturonase [Neorhizobium galegae]|uniref:polygalacturonase PglA n=1 Tax=Neorhizobium galegae TaxID=399 RepID=UPI001AE5A544|nr:glycoside hydrolase family 28 protein [Neorhizobium galegae]MBP2551157.1 polygalacturonase [Neorhizobium galegae]